MGVSDCHAHDRYKTENKMGIHNIGSHLVLFLSNTLFKSNLSDIMSGYCAFNRQFVENYPILVEGFEIETGMTLYTLDKCFRCVELPITYKDHHEGSTSKFNTFHDGVCGIKTIINIIRYCRPLSFWASLPVFFFAALWLPAL